MFLSCHSTLAAPVLTVLEQMNGKHDENNVVWYEIKFMEAKVTAHKTSLGYDQYRHLPTSDSK